MNEAIGTRNPWKSVAMVLLAMLVLVVVTVASLLQPPAKTEAGAPVVHPGVHATSAGGPGFAGDPYFDRHAEVVAGYQQGDPR